MNMNSTNPSHTQNRLWQLRTQDREGKVRNLLGSSYSVCIWFVCISQNKRLKTLEETVHIHIESKDK